MRVFNTNHLAGSVLAVLACASFVGCTRTADQNTGTFVSPGVTQDTASSTTIAADDTAAPPPATDAGTGAAGNDASSAPATKSTKHSKAKSKAKKAHKKAAAEASTQDDSYFYDSDLASTDEGMLDPSQNVGAVDASPDFDDTISGTTQAPWTYRETGLSPFAQEPNSRIPAQIGSGQLTGEDKGTTVFEGPGLFQDPSALGRDLIR